MRARSASEGGWLLVGLIVVISSVFVAMTGLALGLAEGRRTVSLRENDTEAVYLAQAGVMEALYDFRRGNGVIPGEQIVDPGPSPGPADDDVFILSVQQADVMLVNFKSTTFATAGVCGLASRDRMQEWRVSNVMATGGTRVVINTIQVSWSPNLAERLVRIDFNGTTADWTDCAGQPSGAVIDLTLTVPPAQRTVKPTQVWATNRLWFNSSGAMSGKTIDVTFGLSDGTSRTAHYELGVQSRSADFTIKSVGEVRKGPFPFQTWRRVAAEHRVCSTALLPKHCDSTKEEQTATGILRSYRELTTKNP